MSDSLARWACAWGGFSPLGCIVLYCQESGDHQMVKHHHLGASMSLQWLHHHHSTACSAGMGFAYGMVCHMNDSAFSAFSVSEAHSAFDTCAAFLLQSTNTDVCNMVWPATTLLCTLPAASRLLHCFVLIGAAASTHHAGWQESASIPDCCVPFADSSVSQSTGASERPADEHMCIVTTYAV